MLVFDIGVSIYNSIVNKQRFYITIFDILVGIYNYITINYNNYFALIENQDHDYSITRWYTLSSIPLNDSNDLSYTITASAVNATAAVIIDSIISLNGSNNFSYAIAATAVTATHTAANDTYTDTSYGRIQDYNTIYCNYIDIVIEAIDMTTTTRTGTNTDDLFYGYDLNIDSIDEALSPSSVPSLEPSFDPSYVPSLKLFYPKCYSKFRTQFGTKCCLCRCYL
jgi:hypothetical protein